MRTAPSAHAFHQAVSRTTLAVSVGMFILIQTHPLDDARRLALNVLLLIFTIITFLAVKNALPRHDLYPAITYGGILFHCSSIAVADYLLVDVDLAPLYILRIIISAMISDRRAAFATALLAGILQPLVAIANNMWNLAGETQFGIRVVVYLLSAFLVSELAHALTLRWRDAARQAEEQRAEIARRADELAALHQVSLALVSLEDFDATFRQVTERIANLLHAEKCFIAHIEGDTMRGLPPGYGVTDEQVARFAYRIDDTWKKLWHLRQREFVIMNDLGPVPPAAQVQPAALGVERFVAARLMWHGQPTGFVVVGNKRAGVFDEKDARLLSILAGQASSAVENARLYQEAQTSLQNLMRLYAISAQLVSQRDPAEIPQRVVEAIAQALHAPSATVILLNPSTGELEYAAAVGMPEEARSTPFRRQGVAMTVLRTGEPRFVEDVDANADVNPVSKRWGFRSFACVPIRHGAQTIGVLFVNFREARVFTEHEKNILAIFANQIAVVLENARLYRAEKTKTTELSALANLSHALAETMNLDEIFRAIEQQVRINLRLADAGVLLLFDAPSNLLVPRGSFGFNRDALAKVCVRPGEALPGRVFAANRAMIVSGREAIAALLQESMRPENLQHFQQAAYLGGFPQSAIAAPMHTGGNVLGVIVVDNFRSPRGFTPDDLRLLEAIADRAALAIRNAQLFEQERKRAMQLNALAEVGSRVASILDLDRLFPAIVRLIRARFEYRYVYLFLNDPAARQTILRTRDGPTLDLLEPGGFAPQFGQSIVGWVAVHGETILANDVAREPRFAFHPSVPDTRAELATPIKSPTRRIGVLDVQSDKLNAFDQSDVATLETLSNQVAIAIENAQLYGELREQAQRDSLTQVYNHGYFLTRLHQEVASALEHGRVVSLIMLDLDHFKEYNDSYGHVIGDQVLGTIVKAIQTNIKHTDTVGRWGGEEFGIVLAGADMERTLIVAERIRKTLAGMRIEKDARTIAPPTVSQGIATLPIHASDAAALIDFADAALYHAKARGRDQVQIAENTWMQNRNK